MEKTPVASPDLKGNEEKYVVDAIRSTWISSKGAYVTRFEHEFAALCGARTAISVSNGTLALHLALLGLDVRPGDEILLPSLTYIATANAVRYIGAEPVFIDVDPNTWCIDPNLIEANITHRTKGIIAVHLYGHPADMDAINQIASDNGLWVIEDAAEAHFARYKGQIVGNLAQMTTFSFYGNKIITCGEGGAITLSDDQLDTHLRMLRDQGTDPKRQYYFPIIGYNYRLTNIACALLCAQIERTEQLLNKRRNIFSKYRQFLDDIPGVGFQPIASWAEISPWLFCITIDENKYGHSRDELIAKLDANGVETRPFFIPIHTLPPYEETFSKQGELLPVSDRLGHIGLNLPTYTDLSDDQIEFIAHVIRDSNR